jgi:hypothetical protein
MKGRMTMTGHELMAFRNQSFPSRPVHSDAMTGAEAGIARRG